MNLAVGEQFGGYRLTERLGIGGLAEVWLATERDSARSVALKIFSGRLGSEDAERLRAEVELLAAHAIGDHPNVVAVLGGGAEPAPHVVMEYVAGRDLSELLTERGRLLPPEALAIGRAVASALAAAAAVGIVHRDVKPSNVLMADDGAIKLSDFNIARIVGFVGASVSGQVMLSFAYAAPEVWEGRGDARSDLYALGAVLYECLAGKPPFGGSYTEVFRGHLQQPPDLEALPLDVPDELRKLIAELLAKNPADRPVDAATVAGRVDNLLSEVERKQADKLPAALGPWVIEIPHPVLTWAWRTRHKDTGEAATVELLFSADASLGDQLQRAVKINPDLVPLGAERLLGSNRLLLRPGEGFPQPVPAPFAFWVAREELPPPPRSRPLDAIGLAKLVGALQALQATAGEADLDLDLSPNNLIVLPDGSPYLLRPGLPSNLGAKQHQPPAASLRSLALPALGSMFAGVSSLAELATRLSDQATTPRPQVGLTAVARSRSEAPAPDSSMPGEYGPSTATVALPRDSPLDSLTKDGPARPKPIRRRTSAQVATKSATHLPPTPPVSGQPLPGESAKLIAVAAALLLIIAVIFGVAPALEAQTAATIRPAGFEEEFPTVTGIQWLNGCTQLSLSWETSATPDSFYISGSRASQEGWIVEAGPGSQRSIEIDPSLSESFGIVPGDEFVVWARFGESDRGSSSSIIPDCFDATPSPAAEEPSAALALVGSWVNADDQTDNWTHLEFSVAAGSLTMIFWGACHPTDCGPFESTTGDLAFPVETAFSDGSGTYEFTITEDGGNISMATHATWDGGGYDIVDVFRRD